MSAKGPLVWIGEAREKKILEICGEHMKKVVDTVTGLKNTLEGFLEKDRKKQGAGFKAVFNAERAADELKRKILEELSVGIFHPIHRDEIIRLTMTADEVAANAKAAARKFGMIDPEKIPPKLGEILKKFADELVSAAEAMQKSFLSLTKDRREAIELSHEVEKYEEMVDDLRADELMPELMKWYKRVKDIGLSLLLKELTDNMENVADFCEDVSDIIRVIAVSHA